MENKEIGIGILGLGNVGRGTLEILDRNKAFIEQEIFPNKIKIIGLASRRKPESDINYFFTANAEEIIKHPDVNILVETIGGEYPAYNFIKLALEKKKHVVTANKEVLAKHGYELLEIAQQNNVQLFFEPSVGSAIPILGVITNILTSCPLEKISGILNGTTNYILDSMFEQDMTQEEALKKSQEMGYAEADPSKDINGVDTLYKIFILTSLGFRKRLNLDHINYSGIKEVTLDDIKLSKLLGYRIKLLAMARKEGDKADIRVNPVLIKEGHFLSRIHGANNGVLLYGKGYGNLFFSGAGAGGIAAASMIVSDIIKIIKQPYPLFFEYNFLFKDTEELKIESLDQSEYPFFIKIRFEDNKENREMVKDVLLKEEVTMERIAEIRHKDNTTTIGIITSPVKGSRMKEISGGIKRLSFIKTIGHFEAYQDTIEK